ncbi:MAG: NUDIX hydrolase [Salinisphaeraceae bacterium]|nr:NUDIX hydrolase [Salinisphaeraceae bacterium]
MSDKLFTTEGKYDWTTELTVAAIAETDGRFLMVEERIEDQLVFNQPAGHLEEAETLLEAVVRETLEETGWHVKPQAISGLYLWKSPRRGTTILRTSFIVQAVSEDVNAVLDEGIERAVWLTREEIAASPRLRSDFVLRSIDDYLKGQRFPLETVTHLGV